MTTTIINIKVKNIRPIYSNLQDWMKNPNHEYIGRCGIVFINGEIKRFAGDYRAALNSVNQLAERLKADANVAYVTNGCSKCCSY